MPQRFLTFQAHKCGEIVARSCSRKKGVIENFVRLWQESTSGWRPVNLLKKRLWHRCFPVNSAKSFRAPFLKDSCRRRWSRVGMTVKTIKSSAILCCAFMFSWYFPEMWLHTIKTFGITDEEIWSHRRQYLLRYKYLLKCKYFMGLGVS